MNKASVKHSLVVTTALLLLVVLGYALYDTLYNNPQQGSKEGDKTTTPAPPQEIPLLQEGVAAPNFVLQGLDKKDYMLVDYQGKKPVLIEFFASWCPHCQHSVPELVALQKKYGDKLVILSVNAGDKPPQRSTSQAFKDQYGVTYPILEDPSDAMIEAYHLQSFPTMYLVDKTGKIRWAKNATLNAQEAAKLSAEIDQLL